MDEPLPNEFDIIVVGTGLPESVLSGALSRINQKVLHLDANDYYGSNWASFNINAFDDLMKYKDDAVCTLSSDIDVTKLLNSEEKYLPITRRSCISDRQSHCFLRKNVPDAHASPSSNANDDLDDTTPSTNDVESGDSSKQEEEESKDDSEDSKSNDVAENESSASSAKEQAAKSVAEDEKLENTQTSSEVTSEQAPKPQLVSPHDEFYNQWRHFNIDLTSKVLFSRGLLVELLIQSNVSRYLEFRNVSQLLTLMNNQLHHVPCTRADVFKSKVVSVVQKRVMMRILTMCANNEQHAEIERDYKDKKFVEFLVANKLCKEAQHFIIHSIAMVSEDASTLEGVKATKKFLQSLGRYGNCAYLFPTYGIGEIPQSFSRLSAVFGGLFCLRRCAIGLVVDKETGECRGIIDSTGQKIRSRYVVLGETDVPDVAQTTFKSYVSRAVYVTDGPLTPISLITSSTSKPPLTDNVSVISVPATDSRGFVRLVEAGPAATVCPPKRWLLHAASKSQPTSSDIQSPPTIFKDVEDALFASNENNKDVSKDDQDQSSAEGGDAKPTDEMSWKPKLLWQAYFNVLEEGVDSKKLPQNVFVMSGPGDHLGFDSAMSEARRIFEVICPEEEFLPRAPEPDEIVFNDEGYNTEKNGSSSSDALEEEGEYGEREDEMQNEDPTAEDNQPAPEQHPVSDEPSDQGHDQKETNSTPEKPRTDSLSS